ncbi:MAG: hypothetical protein OIN87_01645 [Candidatus Methanoperedens sp.]|nr:hypothetical protein [Candidatus Methanoperedens sp.]
MSRLFIIPSINIFEVHDSVVRDWLTKLDEAAIHRYLENPFKLERYFDESARHALICVEKVHKELLNILDIIDPHAVFLDISTDLSELENRYNKRLISPHKFWEEYYETVSIDMNEPARTLYRIYITQVIEKNTRLIESKDRLPLSTIFYGMDKRSREEIIPVYEEVFEKDGDFLLQAARAANEIINFREKPKHLWYSSKKTRQMAISYEETNKFYDEFLNRLKRLLEFKARDYFVKSLKNKAGEFAVAYEKFLDNKMIENEMIYSNIIEGLKILTSQSGNSSIAIICDPINIAVLLDLLGKNMGAKFPGITVETIDVNALLNEMKPFLQKNRIMQSNYDIALNILGREKPKKYTTSGSVIVPLS